MLLSLLACTAELTEDRAFVLLGAEALEVGWRVVVDDELYAPVLPVVVQAGAPVLVEGPADEAVELLLAPGELAWLDGAGNADGWELGRDLEEDALLVDAPEEVVEQLAEDAALDLDEGPDALWVLSGPGALTVSELVGQPEDVFEAFPVDIDEAVTEGWVTGGRALDADTAPTIVAEGATVTRGPGAAALGLGRARSLGDGLGGFGEVVGDGLGRPDPRLVGLFELDGRCLSLRFDGLWSFCDGPAAGSWGVEDGELVLHDGERIARRELVRR